MPIAFTCFTNSWPKIRSRSRSRYRGTVSQGKASRINCAVHSAVGCAVTAKCRMRGRSGAGTRAPAHPALCRHRTSHSGVDGAVDARSLSLGHGAAVPAAGPRSDLWPGVREASEGDGHPTGVVSAAFSVATCLRRAGHRHDPPRMPGSRDRVQRTQPAPAPPGIRGLLSSEPRSLGVGKRYSGAATDPAAGVWTDCVDTGARRAASSIRAARRVNPALQMMPLSGTSIPIRRQTRASDLVIRGRIVNRADLSRQTAVEPHVKPLNGEISISASVTRNDVAEFPRTTETALRYLLRDRDRIFGAEILFIVRFIERSTTSVRGSPGFTGTSVKS